jgi:fucose 4-O-acetylase-like acetyltransferase
MIGGSMKFSTQELWTLVFSFLIFILLIIIFNEIFIFPNDNYKPDGELYLHIGNESRTIYLGHDAIISFCRGGFEGGYEEYHNLTCEERFEGCGAVNCECWVN